MAKFYIFREKPVTLFPMFNILICILGCLIFILISIIILSLGVGKSVVFDSERFIESTKQKEPTYVEWNGTNLIIHPIKDTININIAENKYDSFEELYISIENQIIQTPLENVLQNISINKSEKYLIVLVRPSGFNNFINIRDFIISKGISIGYEPINQDWKIHIK